MIPSERVGECVAREEDEEASEPNELRLMAKHGVKGINRVPMKEMVAIKAFAENDICIANVLLKDIG